MVTLSPLVFHRQGAALGDFRKAWAKACAKAQAERGARDRAAEVERRAAERRDFAVRPTQPKP